MQKIISNETWSLLNCFFGERLFIEEDSFYIDQNDPYDGTMIGVNKKFNAVMYDSHKFLFLKLFHLKALWGRPLRIIHIDRHWDSLVTEISILKLSNGIETLTECLKFVQTFLHEGNFLRAACYADLIDEIVFIVPEASEEKIAANLKLFQSYPHLSVSHHFNLEQINDMETHLYVLDLDMDYFFEGNGNKKLDDKILIDILSRQWLSIGVALSPKHCGGGLEIPLDMFNRCSRLVKK